MICRVGFLVMRESFFREVTSDLSNSKACLVNNLPLGNEGLKCILHDSLASFDPSALLNAEKFFPHKKPKGSDKKGKEMKAE